MPRAGRRPSSPVRLPSHEGSGLKSSLVLGDQIVNESPLA